MAGNALDRVKAKVCIERAEEALGGVCSQINSLSHAVQELSNEYTGKNEQSAISKVYTEYVRLMRECMDSFGGQNKHIFIDYHKGLLALINQGADGDEIRVDIGAHNLGIEEPRLSSATPGIKDFNIAKRWVESVKYHANTFVEATDDVIAAYQALWWTADEAGNVAIQDKAHEAANKIRELIQEYAEKFEKINEAFNEAILANEEQQNLSKEELSTRANKLYNILQDINFNTISMEQDAAQMIASNWRNSL